MPTVSSEDRFIPKEKLTAWERWELAAIAEEQHESATRSAAESSAHDSARAHAYAVGLEEGRKAGYAAGLQSGAALAREQGSALAGIANQAEFLLETASDAVARRAVDLAFVIASRLLHSELTTRPEHIVSVVRAAMNALPDTPSRIQITVNPDDAGILREHLPAEQERKWRIVPDASITRGGCRMSCTEGDLDAALETRWAAIAKALGTNVMPEPKGAE